MNKTKLIIKVRFNGKQTLEDVFLSAFQSESYQLLQDNSSSIMSVTEQSQDSFSSRKEKTQYMFHIRMDYWNMWE